VKKVPMWLMLLAGAVVVAALALDLGIAGPGLRFAWPFSALILLALCLERWLLARKLGAATARKKAHAAQRSQHWADTAQALPKSIPTTPHQRPCPARKPCV
jgi:hypothetical protein